MPTWAEVSERVKKLKDEQRLSESDFTKPGESIPKDAGLADFIKYNVAHFDPTSEENMINVGGMASPIKKVGSNITKTAIKRLSDVIGDKKIKIGKEHQSEYLSRGAWKEKEFNYRLNTLEDPYVYVKDNKVVGHIGITPEGQIDAVYVDPEYRRQGIAEKLFKHVAKENKSISGEKMSSEPEVINLWNKLKKENPEIKETNKGYTWNVDESSKLAMDAASRMARAKKMGFDTSKSYYHGTDKIFDEFKPSSGGYVGPGIYTTPSEVAARNYGENIMPLNLKAQKTLDISNPETAMENAKNVAEELGLKLDPKLSKFHSSYNPTLPYNSLLESLRNDVKSKNPKLSQELIGSDWHNLLNKKLKDAGYDSIAYTHNDAPAMVVFEPNQIRSTKAAFDPKKAKSGKIMAGVLGGISMADMEKKSQNSTEEGDNMSMLSQFAARAKKLGGQQVAQADIQDDEFGNDTIKGAVDIAKGKEMAESQGIDTSTSDPADLKQLATDEETVDSPEEISNQSKIAQILIGLAPSLIGYAAGGYAGGKAGAEAGLKGMEHLQKQKEEEEKLREKGVEESRKQRELELKEMEIANKPAKEMEKAQADVFRMNVQLASTGAPYKVELDPNTGKPVLIAASRSPEKEIALQKAGLELEKASLPSGPQAQAALFAKRLEQSEKAMTDLYEKGFNRATLGSAAQSILPEAFKGEELKLQEQAERNFVNAVLRRESGAAISEAEFKNAEAQYFPRIGDTTDVIKQKEQNRRLVLEGLKAEAGERAMGRIKPPEKSISEEDKQALEWANQNPKDPRSEIIKRKLGM